MLEFATVYLTTPAATVQTVDNGEAALRSLETGAFDVVLLDIEMPGLSGFDVLKRLRSRTETASLPVIMITGREDIVSIDKAFELGATSFVSKPVNWRLLAYQVRFVVRASRSSADVTVAALPGCT